MPPPKKTEFNRYSDWVVRYSSGTLKSSHPQTKKDFAARYGISEYTITTWDRKLKESKGDEVEIFKEHVRERALDPRSVYKWGELYAKMKGLLIDKSEQKITHELSAEDRIRVARETVNGIREQYRLGGGCCPVCGEYPTLRHEPCLDTEPEFTEDREVETLALPAGTA